MIVHSRKRDWRKKRNLTVLSFNLFTGLSKLIIILGAFVFVIFNLIYFILVILRTNDIILFQILQRLLIKIIFKEKTPVNFNQNTKILEKKNFILKKYTSIAHFIY